jgi:hypothetical protein
MLQKGGKFEYYASQRWIPSDNIKDVVAGPEGDILLLTDNGLARIILKK